MNELKAQLIRAMQSELDELKNELLRLPPEEILGRAYEYAMKTEIIFAAHNSELEEHQMQALANHPAPLSDVYNKYLKHDESSLSEELENCLVEESNIEIRHQKYSDAFFVDNERKCVVWIYYNPDSYAGGQYVTNVIGFDKLAKISATARNVDDYFNTQISTLCTQYLADIGTDDYVSAEKMFYDNPDFINATYDTMQALSKVALIDEWENELENDLPSFMKSAFAWDELQGYGSIEEIDYGEHPAKVVRDFFKKESGSTYIYDGEYTDCEWTLTECDGKPVINISILRDGEHKPFCSFDKEFSWDDISNAVVNRIKQESVYQKIISNCYRFTKNNENNYTVYDPEEGKTIVSGSDIQLKECFKKLLNKREAEMIIQNEVVPSLAQADEQYENSQKNDDMEIEI